VNGVAVRVRTGTKAFTGPYAAVTSQRPLELLDGFEPST
jgi:hypothetical protein